MADKPTVAFVLSLFGGIIYLLVGLVVSAFPSFLGSYADLAGVPGVGVAIAVVGGVGLISGVLMFVGSIMMKTTRTSRVRMGSVLVLVFTIIGAAFTVGGFGVGFILALIGSIMGLVWKPSAQISSQMPTSTAPTSP